MIVDVDDDDDDYDGDDDDSDEGTTKNERASKNSQRPARGHTTRGR